MILFLIILINIVCVFGQESWVVNTEYGDVRGYWSNAYNVWSFLGMPYAEAPVGNLRFQPPLPRQTYNGILEATNSSIICIQQSYFGSGVRPNNIETDDCLIINVYVPQSARTQGPLPVLFFAHGGGFVTGNSNGYNPYLTTRHDVVLVTFNYRIGTFGYICLGTERVPGNIALKDTISALRWVQKNIAPFGGDPNAVTIYGESASAINVEALVLSQATKDLFHRAIIESGSVLGSWSFNYNRVGLAKAVALSIGADYVDDLEKLADFYETITNEEMRDGIRNFRGSHSLCIERQLEDVESIVPDDVVAVVRSGNYNTIPIMFAYATLEGLTMAAIAFNSVLQHNDMSQLLSKDLYFESEIDKNEFVRRINQVYFNNNPITADSYRDFVDFHTDNQFFGSIFRSAVYHSRNSENPMYMMEFGYLGAYNQVNNFTEYNAASHADIVSHVMDLGTYNNETELDITVRRRMTTMFTNFVKYGNPTPEGNLLGIQWPAFEETNQYYLEVTEDLEVRQFPWRERAQLWFDVYEKHYYPPPMFQTNASAFNRASILFAMICSLFIIF